MLGTWNKKEEEIFTRVWASLHLFSSKKRKNEKRKKKIENSQFRISFILSRWFGPLYNQDRTLDILCTMITHAPKKGPAQRHNFSSIRRTYLLVNLKHISDQLCSTSLKFSCNPPFDQPVAVASHDHHVNAQLLCRSAYHIPCVPILYHSLHLNLHQRVY